MPASLLLWLIAATTQDAALPTGDHSGAEVEDLSAAECEFGDICAFVEDLDGDGSPDLLVGSRAQIQVVSWSRSRVLFDLALEGPIPSSRRAGSTADINGDGVRDIILETNRIGADDRDQYTTSLHDGKTGAELRVFEGMSWMDSGDLDGDGTQELLVASGRTSFLHEGVGWVGVFNAHSGDFIHRWEGRSGAAVGRSACITDDMDGDGSADIVYLQTEGEGIVRLVYRSSRTGAVLETTLVPMGHARIWPGSRDLDADGGGEFLVAGPGDSILAYSPRSGSVVRKLVEPRGAQQENWTPSFGESAWFLDDFDGDGVSDIAVGLRQARFGDGALAIYSGKTGQVLHWIPAPVDTMEHFGSGLTSADVNADGSPDLLVLASSWKRAIPGTLHLVDGKTLKVRWTLRHGQVSSWPR